MGWSAEGEMRAVSLYPGVPTVCTIVSKCMSMCQPPVQEWRKLAKEKEAHTLREPGGRGQAEEGVRKGGAVARRLQWLSAVYLLIVSGDQRTWEKDVCPQELNSTKCKLNVLIERGKLLWLLLCENDYLPWLMLGEWGQTMHNSSLSRSSAPGLQAELSSMLAPVSSVWNSSHSS